MSPAGRGARLPGEAPQSFCERCGRSVEAASIGHRVGLCHCPACDLFACRSCWSEAAEACPECGVSYAEARPTEVLTAALTAGALAANALRDEALAADGPPPARPEEPPTWDEEQGSEVPAAWGGAAAAWAAVPDLEPAATTAGQSQVMHPWKARGVGASLGVAAVLMFAMILGNPFQAGGVESATNQPNSPAGSFRVGGFGAGTASPGAEESPTGAAATDPPATDPIAEPTGGTTPTARPTATPTARPGATATPGAPTRGRRQRPRRT